MLGGFDLELEAHRALADRGQAGDHADHVEVAAFELGRQPVGHAQVGHGRGPEETGGERQRNDEMPAFECRDGWQCKH